MPKSIPKSLHRSAPAHPGADTYRKAYERFMSAPPGSDAEKAAMAEMKRIAKQYELPRKARQGIEDDADLTRQARKRIVRLQ